MGVRTICPRRPKVVVFSSVHKALDARIFYRQAVYASRAGYDVVVIADHDKEEVRDGIRIRPFRKPRSRAVRFLSTWRFALAALRERGDIYHFHDPELILVGLVLKLLGKRVLYDAHENVPTDIMAKQWIPGCLRALVARTAAMVELVSSRVLDRTVAATPLIAARFPPRKTVTIQNFARLDEFESVEAVPYGRRQRHVVYVGGISARRGIKEMLVAVGSLPDHLGTRLILAGDFGSRDLENEMRSMPSWARVDYRGWLGRRELTRLLGTVRVGLVVVHPTVDFIEGYPLKLFEYMAAGLPVVASDFPCWREIVGKTGAGILVNPMDPEEIANAMLWLLKHPTESMRMGEKGRMAVQHRYSWDMEAAKLLSLYKQLLPR